MSAANVLPTTDNEVATWSSYISRFIIVRMGIVATTAASALQLTPETGDFLRAPSTSLETKTSHSYTAES
ncbi:hypothetical protein ON010_g17493 [Phytophthora cinnamomi]|nr:hypothetical protein ON010_g17493 [Phytophthora cinnamomi]